MRMGEWENAMRVIQRHVTRALSDPKGKLHCSDVPRAKAN